MSALKKSPAHPISEAEYLAGEPLATVRHEYIDGDVYAMAGASVNHNRISMNIGSMFAVHLKGKPCQPYMSDLKVRVQGAYFYPDVVVDCSPLSGDAYYTEQPTILVEVLSKSTRRTDQVIKSNAYQLIASLQEYVLIEQDFVDVTVLRRSDGWRSRHYFMGDVFELASIGLTCAVADIYDRVQNSDVSDWLAAQAAASET